MSEERERGGKNETERERVIALQWGLLVIYLRITSQCVLNKSFVF